MVKLSKLYFLPTLAYAIVYGVLEREVIIKSAFWSFQHPILNLWGVETYPYHIGMLALALIVSFATVRGRIILKGLSNFFLFGLIEDAVYFLCRLEPPIIAWFYPVDVILFLLLFVTINWEDRS